MLSIEERKGAARQLTGAIRLLRTARRILNAPDTTDAEAAQAILYNVGLSRAITDEVMQKFWRDAADDDSIYEDDE